MTNFNVPTKAEVSPANLETFYHFEKALGMFPLTVRNSNHLIYQMRDLNELEHFIDLLLGGIQKK